jgi:signal transduction histidine kinase
MNKKSSKQRQKEPQSESFEEANIAIKKIKHARFKKAEKVLVSVLKWVFFPITLFYLLLKHFFDSRQARLTTKTTILFSTMYALLIASYAVFIVLSVKRHLAQVGGDANFVVQLIFISIIAGIIFIFIGTVMGAIISNGMLRPIRRMIDEIDEINEDNLSKRLEPVDSQDEIMELVEQINNMLSIIEESFSRQANFVADASHELKTPLSVISGYSEILREWGKEDREVLEEGLSAIRRESLYMAKIIDQMLLLTRLGRIAAYKQKVDISLLTRETVESYAVINDKYDIRFFSDGELFAECDRYLFVEALRTLIDNAIKYTQVGGKIEVAVKQEQGLNAVSVKDNGEGIDAADLPFIFDRFFRCDKARGREKGSVGLGLTICKNIIELMDGEIAVKSEKGKGTEFKIIFE